MTPRSVGISVFVLVLTLPISGNTQQASSSKNPKLNQTNVMSKAHDFLDSASRGETDAIKELLDAKLDPNVSDYEGKTALMIAAGHGHIEIIQLLLT